MTYERSSVARPNPCRDVMPLHWAASDYSVLIPRQTEATRNW